MRSHDRDNCCVIHSHKLLRFQQAQAVAISAMRFHLMNFKKIFKLAFMMCVTTRNVFAWSKNVLVTKISNQQIRCLQPLEIFCMVEKHACDKVFRNMIFCEKQSRSTEIFSCIRMFLSELGGEYFKVSMPLSGQLVYFRLLCAPNGLDYRLCSINE